MAPKKSTDLFVTAAMVAIKRADGSLAYLYKGARVPGGLDPGEEKRLLGLGMIGAGPAVPIAAVAPTVARRGAAKQPAASGPPVVRDESAGASGLPASVAE